jgi:phosphoglycolate phosphatase-like HAD superfamily hydrolase
LKHSECFIPNYIRFFGLQGVSKYAREAAEFVNLYSKTRGINRFLALVRQLDLLRRHPEVVRRNTLVPELPSLTRWIESGDQLGNPALERAVAATNDPELKRVLEWSVAVNDSVRQMVRDLPPFPSVRTCLEQLGKSVDLLVVSATPSEALNTEWREHGIDEFVRAIWGQEHGTKRQMLEVAKQYDRDHALMIGDAPGDCEAAAANGCLFFPINPGSEEASWHRLAAEGADRFLSGTFAGNYQVKLMAEFDAALPERPPWLNDG